MDPAAGIPGRAGASGMALAAGAPGKAEGAGMGPAAGIPSETGGVGTANGGGMLAADVGAVVGRGGRAGGESFDTFSDESEGGGIREAGAGRGAAVVDPGEGRFDASPSLSSLSSLSSSLSIKVDSRAELTAFLYVVCKYGRDMWARSAEHRGKGRWLAMERGMTWADNKRRPVCDRTL